MICPHCGIIFIVDAERDIVPQYCPFCGGGLIE